jgi:aminoglycoside phosphotransferase (APT) family kinase protein
MSTLALHTMRFHQLLQRVRRPLAQLAEQLVLEQHTPVVDRLLMQLIKEHQGEFSGRVPQIVSALRTRSDVAIFMISDSPGAPATKVLKLPLTIDAQQSIKLHHKVVDALHNQRELEDFCALVPRALAWGVFEGQAYYLETALPGIVTSDLIRQRNDPTSLKQTAIQAILRLHTGTLRREVVDDMLFATIAGNDLALLYQLAERWPEAALLRDKLRSLEAILRCQIYGRELSFAWSHGDYWPGNILMQPGDGMLSGIVDWDRATPRQLPLLDVLHLLAFIRKMQQRSEVGEEIVTYLLPAQFDITERTLIDRALEQLGLPTNSAFLQSAVLLYWLRFAAANLARYAQLRKDNRWLSKNVFIVLKRGMA